MSKEKGAKIVVLTFGDDAAEMLICQMNRREY